MKFTYTPGDESAAREWLVKPEKMANVEAEAIERVSGLRFPEWNEELRHARMSAVHALLWVLLRRDIPGLKYEAVEFTAEEYELDFDDDEKVELLRALEEGIEAGDVLSPEQEEARVELSAAVGHLLVADEPKEAAPAADPDFEGEAPKASSEPSLVS